MPSGKKKKEIVKGMKFNKLTILDEIFVDLSPSGQKRRKFLCICDCGNETEVLLNNFKKTISCGCYLRSILSSKAKHGLYHHSLYRVWCGMKQRCHNKNNIYYIDYGGRGIKMCEEWFNDFITFYN